MGAPTIAAHGTEEQKQRYLRPLFTGEEVWCQLFSEPGAGSDVASLATHGGARRRRVDRQRPEGVDDARPPGRAGACSSPAPTPTQPKHKGMTYFVVDMHEPGVEVRPLRQITGEAEFNEVYFTDARIPDAERLGDVGEAGGSSLTTLMNERVVDRRRDLRRAVAAPIGEAARRCGDERRDKRPGDARPSSMKLWVDAEVLRLTNIRAAAEPQGGHARARGVDRQAGVRRAQQGASIAFCIDLLGADGMLYRRLRDDAARARPSASTTVQKAFLRVRANSIEGGTSEVMRNILGERVLGLPGDVRVDKDVPWKEVPRN